MRIAGDAGETIEADDVISCVPAYAAADALDTLDRPLSALLRQTPYISSAVVVVAYRRADMPHALDATGLVARQLDRDDLEVFDHILTMDDDNHAAVLRLGPIRAKVEPLLAYAPETGIGEVPDPYYDGRFELVYRLVDVACEELLATLRREHDL